MYVRQADTNGFINIYSSTLSNLLVNLNFQVTKRKGEGSKKVIFKCCLGWTTSYKKPGKPEQGRPLPGLLPWTRPTLTPRRGSSPS